MESYSFNVDSSCPVPRPAPELLEIVVKQKDGNPNWRAKYIVATKVTRGEKFRQRPHHMVWSCARVWLGEIHTLTQPDGSARYGESDNDDDSTSGGAPANAASTPAAKGKKGSGESDDVDSPESKPAAGMNSSQAAASGNLNDNNANASSSSAAANSGEIPQLPISNTAVMAANSAAGGGGSQLPLNLLNMQMNYSASIAPFLPLISSVLNNSQGSMLQQQMYANAAGALQSNAFQQQQQRKVANVASGGKPLPALPDMLICIRPCEGDLYKRSPIMFIQTHGGQEYLLVKHGGTYFIDVAPEHEVCSVRISMKNEKPRTLPFLRVDPSQALSPYVGQAQDDLEDISRTLPPGTVVPVVYPPNSGDSPFHQLTIDRGFSTTLPTVVLHQLHEPQHLHTEQTFAITPFNKQQRKIRKVLLPPPPSKPSAAKISAAAAAAAGMLGAIPPSQLPDSVVSSSSGSLGMSMGNSGSGSKPKKRAKKSNGGTSSGSGGLKGEDSSTGGPDRGGGDSGGENNSDSDHSEPAGLDGLGRKRKKKPPPPSVLARLRPTNPARHAAAAAAASLGGGAGGVGGRTGLDGFGGAADLDNLQAYYTHITKKAIVEESTEEEVSEDDGEDVSGMGESLPALPTLPASSAAGGAGDGSAGQGGAKEGADGEDGVAGASGGSAGPKRRVKKKKARLLIDTNTVVGNPQLLSFLYAHDPRRLTRLIRAIFAEVRKHPDYYPEVYAGKAAAAAEDKLKEDGEGKDGSSSEIKQQPAVIPQGQFPAFWKIQLDWGKFATILGDDANKTDVYPIWKYVLDHAHVRQVADLRELSLRSVWTKPLDLVQLAAKVRAKSTPAVASAANATAAAAAAAAAGFLNFPGLFNFPFLLGANGANSAAVAAAAGLKAGAFPFPGLPGAGVGGLPLVPGVGALPGLPGVGGLPAAAQAAVGGQQPKQFTAADIEQQQALTKAIQNAGAFPQQQQQQQSQQTAVQAPNQGNPLSGAAAAAASFAALQPFWSAMALSASMPHAQAAVNAAAREELIKKIAAMSPTDPANGPFLPIIQTYHNALAMQRKFQQQQQAQQQQQQQARDDNKMDMN